MENKPRYLTICSDNYYHPKIFVQGRYLEDYGFEVGAQVTLTNPKSGVLMVNQTRSAEAHQANRARVYLLNRLATLKKENDENSEEILSIQKELDNS